MISWQIFKDNKSLSKALYFPDFASQAYLLHIFDVGAEGLDEYGSWVYKKEDMKRLKIVLDNWLERNNPAGKKVVTIETLIEGKGLLNINEINILLNETISAIDVALKEGGELYFSGD